MCGRESQRWITSVPRKKKNSNDFIFKLVGVLFPSFRGYMESCICYYKDNAGLSKTHISLSHRLYRETDFIFFTNLEILVTLPVRPPNSFKQLTFSIFLSLKFPVTLCKIPRATVRKEGQSLTSDFHPKCGGGLPYWGTGSELPQRHSKEKVK